MAESLCQKRALEAFQLDPAKWGGKWPMHLFYPNLLSLLLSQLMMFTGTVDALMFVGDKCNDHVFMIKLKLQL